MERIYGVLIGDLPRALDAVIKTSALFVTAAILFRFTERRTLAELARTLAWSPQRAHIQLPRRC